MTSMASTTPGGGMATPELRVLAPEDAFFRPALAMVLTGRTQLSGVAEEHIHRLEQAVAQQGLRMDLLVGAFAERRMLSGALTIESPGRTALVYTPPPRNRASDEAQVVLVDVLSLVKAIAPARGIRVLQALLGADENARAEAHAAAGFKYLAELIYLERSVAEPPAVGKCSLPHKLRFVSYTSARRALFRDALAASYVNTLDCPALNGLRDLDDVLDGHKATGVFDPAGWQLAMSADTPVGIILAAMLPTRTAVEVVYMGVTAPARGQGVGNALLAAALEYARRVAATELSLAVDGTNVPARRLYARWSFRETMRRRAWIAAVGLR